MGGAFFTVYTREFKEKGEGMGVSVSHYINAAWTVLFLVVLIRWGGASMIAYNLKSRVVAVLILLPAPAFDLWTSGYIHRIGIRSESVLGYGLRWILSTLVAYWLCILAGLIANRIQPERVFVVGAPENIPIERRLKTRVGWMVGCTVLFGGLAYLLFQLLASQLSLLATIVIAVGLGALQVAVLWSFAFSISLFFYEVVRYRRMFRTRRSYALAGSGMVFLLLLGLSGYIGLHRMDQSMRRPDTQMAGGEDY